MCNTELRIARLHCWSVTNSLSIEISNTDLQLSHVTIFCTYSDVIANTNCTGTWLSWLLYLGNFTKPPKGGVFWRCHRRWKIHSPAFKSGLVHTILEYVWFYFVQIRLRCADVAGEAVSDTFEVILLREASQQLDWCLQRKHCVSGKSVLCIAVKMS